MGRVLKHKTRCHICGRLFYLDKVNQPLPNHAPKGEPEGASFVKCTGSGKDGDYIAGVYRQSA